MGCVIGATASNGVRSDHDGQQAPVQGPPSRRRQGPTESAPSPFAQSSSAAPRRAHAPSRSANLAHHDVLDVAGDELYGHGKRPADDEPPDDLEGDLPAPAAISTSARPFPDSGGRSAPAVEVESSSFHIR